MKYKVGDKVKIKTWGQMEKEYGRDSFGKELEDVINERFPDRILVIEKIEGYFYRRKDFGYLWTDRMIECLASDYKEPVPIISRFELLDLRL